MFRLLILSVILLSYCGAVISQPKRQNQQRQANQQITQPAPSPSPSVQPDAQKVDPEITRQETDHAHNITIVDERSSWPSWVANIISALLLFFVAVQTRTNNRILKSMQTNEEFAHSQSKAMSGLAEATKGQLTTMGEQLSEMSKQTEVALVEKEFMKLQVESLSAQHAVMQGQLAAAETAAQMAQGQLVAMQSQERAMYDQLALMKEQREILDKSVTSAEKNSIYAQRAYVVAKIRDTGKSDQRLQFRLRIQNGGNTPANNVCVFYSSGLRDSPPWNIDAEPFSKMPEQQIVFESGFDQVERLGVVAPKGSYHVISTPETDFESAEDYKQFTLDLLRFYCWGRIVYEDMFNQKRHTDFCFVQSQKQPNGYPGEHGNEAI